MRKIYYNQVAYAFRRESNIVNPQVLLQPYAIKSDLVTKSIMLWMREDKDGRVGILEGLASLAGIVSYRAELKF
jgi:hypothetical protein